MQTPAVHSGGRDRGQGEAGERDRGQQGAAVVERLHDVLHELLRCAADRLSRSRAVAGYDAVRDPWLAPGKSLAFAGQARTLPGVSPCRTVIMCSWDGPTSAGRLRRCWPTRPPASLAV